MFFTAKGPGSIPGQGNKILQAKQPKKKKKYSFIKIYNIFVSFGQLCKSERNENLVKWKIFILYNHAQKSEEHVSDFYLTRICARACVHVCICTEKERKHTFELESVFEEDSVLWGRWEENENYKSACSHVLMWLIVGN